MPTQIQRVSVEVVPPASARETGIHRHPEYLRSLITTPFSEEPACNTVYHCFLRSVQRWGNRNFLGQRSTRDTGERGPYIWESYEAVYDQVSSMGHGLSGYCNLVSPPGPGITQARLGIFAPNSPIWTMMMLASYSKRIVVVPLFDTLGSDSIKFISDNADLQVIATTRAKLTTVIEGKGHALRLIVLFEQPRDSEKTFCQSANVALVSVAELIARGKIMPRSSFKTCYASAFEQPHAASMPRPADWCNLMYTAGTISRKGVILSHMVQPLPVLFTILDALPSMHSLKFSSAVVSCDDVYISFLSLAHIFEQMIEMLLITAGSSIGFYAGDPATLISSDIPELRPTLMAAIPRVYQRIYDKVKGQVAKKGALSKYVFNRSVNKQTENLLKDKRSAFLDRRVFKNVQEAFGGRLRLLANGAAPINPKLHSFISSVLGCNLIQGYGMTEDAGAAVVMPIRLNTVGTVGGPIPCCEIKLIDTDDYKASDKYPQNAEEFAKQCSFKGKFDKTLAGLIISRGEICIRGPNVSAGYFKAPQETSQTWDSMGWLHSGDIGQWNTDGSLSVIGRKNDLFKMATGDTHMHAVVSPEEIEGVMIRSKYIGQICVLGNATEPSLVAIIVPERDVVLEWCRKNKVFGDTLSSVCREKKVKQLFLNEISKHGKSGGLRAWEIPKDVSFETKLNSMGQGFTIDNECLTPTMKLRRQKLEAKYAPAIERMFALLRNSTSNVEGPPPAA